MSVFTILVICYYKGNLLTTEKHMSNMSRTKLSLCPWIYRMLNMVNTTGMEEIELFIEVVRFKPQVNQSVGGYTDLFVLENYNVAEFNYSCGPSSGPTPDTDGCGVFK